MGKEECGNKAKNKASKKSRNKVFQSTRPPTQNINNPFIITVVIAN